MLIRYNMYQCTVNVVRASTVSPAYLLSMSSPTNSQYGIKGVRIALSYAEQLSSHTCIHLLKVRHQAWYNQRSQKRSTVCECKCVCREGSSDPEGNKPFSKLSMIISDLHVQNSMHFVMEKGI